MKSLPFILLLMLGAASLVAEDANPSLLREARKCADGVAKGDLAEVIDHTHPRVLEMMGGHDAAIAKAKSGMDDMRAKGTSFISANLGKPGPLQKVGTWLVAVVPEHIALKVPGGRLEQDASMIGISEDQGQRWYFVDAAVSKDQFFQIFPELQGKMAYPQHKAPVLKKDAH